MTFPADASTPKACPRTTRPWNVLASVGLLFFSGWTLLADLAHDAHFALQPSFSSLFLGLFVMGWTIAAIVYAGFPKRYLIPAVALVTARLSFAWPLTYWLDLRTASLLLDEFLVLLGFVYLVASVKSTAMQGRPWFRWQHSLAMGVVTLLASILSLPAGVLGVANVIEDTSAGYVRLTLQGIQLSERIFEKDGRRVHLIGMAHIADGGFYDALNTSLAEPIEGRRLVLLEGVSDREKILPQSFASGETYRAMAEKLGLAEQALGFAMQSDKPDDGKNSLEAWAERGVDFQRADIDVSELDPAYRDRLVALLGAMGNLSLESFLSMPGDMTAKELEDLMVEGLVKKRNAHLMEVFAEHVSDYAEVFIPWGAAHLPDLDRRLTALGYAPVAEHQRLGIDFWKRFR
jgi:succinate dehydrogenase hydrophobic anchor subunit